MINAGIENNSLDTDSSTTHGISALSRLDRDLTSEPGLTTVVVEEGLSDVLSGQAQTSLEAAYVTLQTELNAWGVKVVYTTMTPCSGNSQCTTGADAVRLAVNGDFTQGWPSSTAGTQQTIVTEDSDAAVATTDTDGTEQITAAYDTGDHVNLNPTGSALIGLPAVFPVSDLAPGLVPPKATQPPIDYQWPLDEGSGDSVDSIDQVLLSYTGVTWGTDAALPTADTSQATTNPTGERPAFDGTTSYGDVGGALLEFGASYSLDVWVRLDTTGDTDQWVLSQNTGDQQGITLGYSGTTQKWTFNALQEDGTTATVSGPAAVAGTWTHLTASYDDDSNAMTLAVNGVHGTTVALTPPDDSTHPDNLTGDFLVGAESTGDPSAGISGQLDGEVSDLTVSF